MKVSVLIALAGLLLPASASWFFPSHTAAPAAPKADDAAMKQAMELQAQHTLEWLKTEKSCRLTPDVTKRLHDILIKTSPRQRTEALRQWYGELLDSDLDSGTEETEFALLNCLAKAGGTANVAKPLFLRMLHCFNNDKPVDNRDWQSMLARASRWEYNITIHGVAIADAVNGAWPRSAEKLYWSAGGGNNVSSRDIANTMKLWTAPREYGHLLLQRNRKVYQDTVGQLVHDSDMPERQLRRRGVRHWRYTWGRDLPATVDKALTLMAARRRAEMPAADRVAELFTAAEPLAGDMRGFLPRCVLAADPAACAWKPLNDDKASLFEMPDVSAVTLPQWKDTLLGTPTSTKDDLAALNKELAAAVKEATLPALLAFSLVEDDLSLPENESRPWMNVDGYDSFRTAFDIEMTQDGVDVLVDEQGPRFSRRDPELRAAYRRVNLALHRCVLKLALAERDGKTEEMNAAADRLADILNKSKAWPLLWNQYSMRGVSPRAYLRLTKGYKGKPELLKVFSEVAHCQVTLNELKDAKLPLTAENLSTMMGDVLTAQGRMDATPQEKEAEAARALARDRKADPKVRGAAVILSLLGPEAPETILKATQDKPECYTRDTYCLRAMRTMRYALEHGDTATARRMHELMLSKPLAKAYPYTRLAAAMLARHEGREAEARRLEKDALALAAYHFSMNEPSTNRRRLMLLFLQYGLVTEAERMQALLGPESVGELRPDLAAYYAAQGKYGAAAYQMESLLHTAIRQSAPGATYGTHRDVAFWRTAADLYRAAYLRGKGQTAAADKLEQAARAAQPELAAKVSLTAPAAAEDCSLPEAADTEPAFESPYYTWTLRPENEGEETIQAEGRIERAYLTDEGASSSWVELHLRSGRDVVCTLNWLTPEDLGNLKNWMELNHIKRYHSRLTQGISFFAKPVEMIQEAPFATRESMSNGVRITNSKRVRFACVHGGYESHWTEEMEPEECRELEATMQPTAGPDTKLRTFDSYEAAEADAALHGRDVLCLLLGKRDSELAKSFLSMAERSPETVAEWNYAYSLYPCYRDEQGQWEPGAQRVLQYARPLLDRHLPEGSAARERELQRGLGILMYTGSLTAYLSPVSMVLRPCAVPPKAVDDARITEFYAAIKAKDAGKVERMLTETPALVNEPLATQYTSPLFSALFFGGPAVIDSLLKHGADPNAYNKQMDSVLHCALNYPATPNVIKALLAAGADPNARTANASENTFRYPLHTCINSPACMQLLLEAGADPTLRDGKGRGVLSCVVSNPAMVELLRRHGKCDPNECSDEGIRPLGMMPPAPPEVVDMLLDWGADPYLPCADESRLRPFSRGITAECADFYAPVQREKLNSNPVFSYNLGTKVYFDRMLEVYLKHKLNFGHRFADGNEILGLLIANKMAGASFLRHLDTLIANGADIHATYDGKPLLYLLAENGGGMSNNGTSYADEAIQTFDALVSKGLDPYAPYADFDNVFDYAESETTSFNRVHTRATEDFITRLRDWQKAHPKKK